QGQVRGDVATRLLQVLAQAQAVVAFLHDHAQQHGELAVVMDFEGGRVLVATRDAGDVPQAQVPALHVDVGVAHGLGVVQAGGQAQVDAGSFGADSARGRHGAALRQGRQDLLRVYAQIVQL